MLCSHRSLVSWLAGRGGYCCLESNCTSESSLFFIVITQAYISCVFFLFVFNGRFALENETRVSLMLAERKIGI